jgi:hypothetical protein
MRFRVTHLLLVCIAVAVFSIAFKNPNAHWAGGIGFLLWLFYAVLGVRAVTRVNERPVLVSALIFGVSFWWLSVSAWWTPTYFLLKTVWDQVGTPSLDGQPLNNFIRIGQHAFSLVFAWCGALLGAYWCKPVDEKD